MSVAEAEISREPSNYSPTDHFVNRYKQRRIPGPAIESCIRDGEVVLEADEETGDVAALFEGEFRGVRYTVVTNPETGEAITVYKNGR